MDKIQPFEINCENRIVDFDEYSFTRLKPYVLEFLNCLIDYILFNLSSIIKKKNFFFIESIKLLDSITLVGLNLPRFKSSSSNYILNWFIILNYYDRLAIGMLNEPLEMIKCLLLHNGNSRDYSMLSSFQQQQQIIFIICIYYD